MGTKLDNEADVLVIGTGAAGGAVCKRLTDAGMRVVALEQGDWVHPNMRPHAHDEWEIEKLRAWAFDPNMRNLPEDYPVTGVTTPMMFNAVGGSTVHYLAHFPRLKPVDFRKGTEHGLGDTIDWPITYEELAPYYEINDAEMGVSGLRGDPANPDKSERQGPPIAPGIGNIKGLQAYEKLGWHWWPGDNAILTRRGQDGRLACNACGNCSNGCPRGSIGDTSVTYLPKAIANGLDLRTRARVARITVGKDGRADGAVYVDMRTGDQHQVKAKAVVLSANGIGTPRLLLMSAQKGHPDGLANGHGHVGRYLMHHTYAFVDLWLEEPTLGHKGAFGGPSYSHEFYESDASRGFVNGFSLFAGLRSYGAATAAMGFATGYMTPWGAGHRQFFDEHFGHHTVVGVQGEDLPVGDNAVTLDPEATDSSGLPAPHVDYALTENDRQLTGWGAERAAEVAEAMGALKTNPTGVVPVPPAWHLMGTARMGHSPEDSVTNKWHQTWEVPNLFVVDGSSMTTGGSANPTSTIGALAVRCAEYIVKNRDAIARQRKTPSNDEAPGL